MRGTMEGIRVLEVATWTYVPAAGAVLAEWGADVIKVEHPEGGDPQRGLVSSGLVPSGPGGVNHMIELPNRGKRSVAIDLSTEEGHDLLMEIAATSDVFLTNLLPPARRSLRIEVEDLRRANPDIVYVRGSGQGQRGPEKDRGGYDGCSFWARTVADIATPEGAEWPANQPGAAFGDLMGGMTIAGGISAALFHRERTGEALVVDNSLLALGLWATSATVMGVGLFGLERMPRHDRTTAANPLVNTYRTADGRFFSIIMLQADRYWPDLVTTLGHPELVDDPRFVDAPTRAQHAAECVAALDEIFASRTFEEWLPIMQRLKGQWAPVETSAELLEDPQVLDNGYVREVESASGSTFRMVPSPLQFDETPPELTRAPDLGEHTDALLQELGHDMDEIIELKVKGAIL
jgi:crotonobetainyl-CoA:carnitine CoA-transferase CaiB-like acyl-CoA transferase